MNPRNTHGMSRLMEIGVVILFGAATQVAGQTPVEQAKVQQARMRELVDRQAAALKAQQEAVVAAHQARVFAYQAPNQNVPEDVRVMQTIVSTALADVERPQMPKDLVGDSTTGVTRGALGVYVYSNAGGPISFGRGDVSGFYMQGYGYLFSVHWPIASAVSFRSRAFDEAHAERPQNEDARSKATAAWVEQYRERLAEALIDVIAGYGSTLRRAKEGESITFIADFGGDAKDVTMTVKADALHGSDVDANKEAIHVSEAQSGMSDRLRTQLKIMSQIIDASLRPESEDQVVVPNVWSTYFGGQAEPQYVPGYGVIFRKNARMSTARTFASLSTGSRREAAIDSVEVTARKTYREHLDTLKRETGDILATYGPTLTELQDDDWVGIYYDVGSAAGLLNGGMTDYLVQARMADIRQAANESDPATWLQHFLVTNEREE